MFFPHCSLLARFALAQGLACALAAHAQTAPLPPPATEAPAATPGDQRIQRIQHEDALTRVDELRVGGEIRSITVAPKNGAPTYQIEPTPGGGNPADARNGSAGKSRWPILTF